MTMNSRIYALSRINAFSSLSAQEIQQIGSYCKCRRYRAGEIIITPVNKGRDVFFIANGSVQAINILPSGNQVGLQDLHTGDMFGELSAIDGAPRSGFIIAMTECLIVSMSAQHFHQTYQKYPTVTDALIRRLVSMVRHLCDKVLERDGCSARDRIRLDLLRRIFNAGQQNIETALLSPTPKHKEIAANASTSRETVTRELGYLESIGIISRQDRQFMITDITRLTSMLAGNSKAPTLH